MITKTDRRETLKRLVSEYDKISKYFMHVQNMPLSFNGSAPLRIASIHLIDMIGSHPDMNMTELADSLGITKGAVSQMASTLEKKGLLKKTKTVGAGKNVMFVLTPEGEKAREGHEEYHEELLRQMDDLLDDISPDELDSFEQILDIMYNTMLEYAVPANRR